MWGVSFVFVSSISGWLSDSTTHTNLKFSGLCPGPVWGLNSYTKTPSCLLPRFARTYFCTPPPSPHPPAIIPSQIRLWYIEVNWLYKHRKKLRSSQAYIPINSCTELSKPQFSLWVSLNHERHFFNHSTSHQRNIPIFASFKQRLVAHCMMHLMYYQERINKAQFFLPFP